MNATPVVERCSDGKLMFDCPGCGLAHAVNVDEGTRPRWGWNGEIQFLNDCTHAHAGKTFPLKPINNEVT